VRGSWWVVLIGDATAFLPTTEPCNHNRKIGFVCASIDSRTIVFYL
jgi:hypothetical protein